VVLDGQLLVGDALDAAGGELAGFVSLPSDSARVCNETPLYGCGWSATGVNPDEIHGGNITGSQQNGKSK